MGMDLFSEIAALQISGLIVYSNTEYTTPIKVYIAIYQWFPLKASVGFWDTINSYSDLLVSSRIKGKMSLPQLVVQYAFNTALDSIDWVTCSTKAAKLLIFIFKTGGGNG